MMRRRSVDVPCTLPVISCVVSNTCLPMRTHDDRREEKQWAHETSEHGGAPLRQAWPARSGGLHAFLGSGAASSTSSNCSWLVEVACWRCSYDQSGHAHRQVMDAAGWPCGHGHPLACQLKGPLPFYVRLLLRMHSGSRHPILGFPQKYSRSSVIPHWLRSVAAMLCSKTCTVNHSYGI